MAENRTDLIDGFGSLASGCHGGLYPSILGETQFAAAVNVSVRGGFARTRPGLTKLFDLGGLEFQGAGLYRLNEGDRIVCVLSGGVYQIKMFGDVPVISKYSVANTTRTGSNGTGTEVFSPDFGKDDGGAWSTAVNMAKAERFFVVQDGYHQPVIIGEHDDADSARVSFQSKTPYAPVDGEASTSVLFSDVPVSRAMGYASARLVVSPRYLWQDLTGVYPTDGSLESGRMYVVASDLDSDPESCLRFIETNTAQGGAIRMPQEVGFVTAMQPFRNSETVDGNGALLAFCQDGINAFNLAYEVSSWGTEDQTISQMLFSGVGTYSPRSVIPVNDDIWFRRIDGIGSVRYTSTQVAGASGSLASTAKSFEVAHRLDLDAFSDLPYVSMAFADNRLLVTTGGRVSGFRGLVSLDTAALYSITEEATPVFDDLWTGLELLQVVSARYRGRDRHFIFARNNGTLGLWYVDIAARTDSGCPIHSRLYTKQFLFSKPTVIKKFDRLELWIRDLAGRATITVYWRPDGSPVWSRMNDVIVNARSPGVAQARQRLTFHPLSENPCNSAGQPMRSGTGFQFCIDWTGSLTLERGVVYATPGQAMEPSLQCEEEAEVLLEIGGENNEVLDDFGYTVTGASTCYTL